MILRNINLIYEIQIDPFIVIKVRKTRLYKIKMFGECVFCSMNDSRDVNYHDISFLYVSISVRRESSPYLYGSPVA